jgi:hypothetical protein
MVQLTLEIALGGIRMVAYLELNDGRRIYRFAIYDIVSIMTLLIV